ncbi:hypothetical protein EUGRSUZ_A02237 [Eucalyptus grandis]|uniref:PGG domain-containing protein n=3 Tax=Eucalyptus TaxID=3932 RepID=A0A059DHV7_EUCGR|nr:hypothetical protein EUGRSUZ_A02237 [Eucalyptus grandis]
MATPTSSNPRKPFFNLFCHGQKRVLPDEARIVLLLLLAVILIASLAFFPAGALNPPGAARWQDDADRYNNRNYAGRAMYYYLKNALYVFMVLFNAVVMELIRSTVGLLSKSIFAIGLFLTCTSSFRSEMFGGTDSVMLTCAASSVLAVVPREIGKFHCVLFAAFFPGVVRNLIQIFCRV